jgi:hypothetical protein
VADDLSFVNLPSCYKISVFISSSSFIHKEAGQTEIDRASKRSGTQRSLHIRDNCEIIYLF